MNKNWNFPKALLFDLDGVLIDSEPLHGQAWKETAALFDLNLTYGQLKLLRGRRRIDCANEIIKMIPKKVKTEDLLNLHKPISRRLIISAQAMPGSESLLKRCHKNNIPMALVTSSSSESIQIKTAHHKWMNLFSVKILGDDKSLVQGKPAPDPYLLAAKKLNIDPKECWAVEDSISGVSSALKAGCFVLFLKESDQKIDKKDFFEKNNNLKKIHDLKEIEEMLDLHQINKVYL
ncbi:HAD family hydrolase [Prochlorococcus marinus]|uniref:HAD family hydrolase n=1 Tax=Prochlorococcus marinus XMU1408 TaxID=2213228 RepID=A0A318RA18_PROMR|nr:HAD family phosphatase [Prochlorococcus marinus]MBW3041646.1 HAD family hydrolase [Prochlorococcus marinus str. XMU1408]PYE02799.1 HAD family hydrolase [Prochlorococcus marinus XMU1408]